VQKDKRASRTIKRSSAKRRIKTIFRPGYQSLIKALITARNKAGITQHELAKKLGRPVTYPTKIEHVDRRLDVMEFIEYAEAVGLDPIALLRKTVLR
jgi:ribosome-binding protein aMBF1 (putative translation factor)